MGRLKSFRKDPVGSLSLQAWFWFHKLTRPVGKIFQKQAEEYLSRARYLDFLARRPSHALRPDFSDLLFLYQTVRCRKPGCVLEFGSGCSTVIIAQALSENRIESSASNGYLCSLDADPYWARVTAQAIPEDLRELCEVRYSSVSEVDFAGTRVFRHARVPEISPNLLYLDGPALTREIQVAVDVLDIEDRFPPDFYGIIDGRWANTSFLKRHLKRRYSFKHRWLFGNSTFQLMT
jgi:hypothetical protein